MGCDVLPQPAHNTHPRSVRSAAVVRPTITGHVTPLSAIRRHAGGHVHHIAGGHVHHIAGKLSSPPCLLPNIHRTQRTAALLLLPRCASLVVSWRTYPHQCLKHTGSSIETRSMRYNTAISNHAVDNTHALLTSRYCTTLARRLPVHHFARALLLCCYALSLCQRPLINAPSLALLLLRSTIDTSRTFISPCCCCC